MNLWANVKEKKSNQTNGIRNKLIMGTIALFGID